MRIIHGGNTFGRGIPRRFSADGSEAVTRHPVKTREDLEIFLRILERSELHPANIEEYPGRLDLWAKYDGIPALGMPRSPLSVVCPQIGGVSPTLKRNSGGIAKVVA
ncbi:MAG: hypothetical protein KGZ25_06520 [Planctomycetes bacterium]|nr:hypothetical protein [Planctomycetota bacterium]